MLAVVRGAVVTVLECDPDVVTPDRRLVADLGADSLALVAFAELVEAGIAALGRPGFAIGDDDLERLATVGDAVDYALARL